MADSGQRLLDVIDDPNALESFLGGLAADAAVDNDVESLARSLAAEFEVDSPSETLFEPLEPSSNLTDLSQSNVPFDFSGYGPGEPDQFQHVDVDLVNPGGGNYDSTATSICDSSYSEALSNHIFNQSQDQSQNQSDGQGQGQAETGQGQQEQPAFSQQQQTTNSLSSLSTSTPTNTSADAPTLISVPSIQPAVSTGSTVYATTSDQSQQQQQHYSYSQLVHAQQQSQQLQQLINTSSAGGLSQGFIIDSNGQPMMVSTGGNTFGGNLALVAGVQPTYAVLPAPTQALFMQPQTIQSIKNSNGTTSYFQTAQGQVIQNVNPTVTQPPAPALQQNLKPKHPPHLLPKPAGKGGAGGNGGGNGTATVTTAQGTVVEMNNTTSVVHSSNSATGGTITMTTANMESITQMIQQQNSATGTMSIGQPSYAIGAGGQVVQVSAVQTLNTMTGPQTIVLNQFGQQMIVPTAAMNQGQQMIILRQQPTQPQVLTIQAPATATTLGAQTAINGAVAKPMVRFMSQISQVPQVTQNQQLQLQQIQTPNGPQWVAVRYPSVTSSAPVTVAQPQVPVAPVVSQPPPPTPPPPVVTTPAPRPPTPQNAHTPTPTTPKTTKPKTPKPKTPKAKPPPKQTQPPPPVSFTPVTTDTISACIASVIARLRSPSPPLTTTTQSNQDPRPSTGIDNCTPPPKKKAKQSKKKKVTLDLEQLLKQSGIMDEDLEDDGCSFADFFSSPAPAAEPEPYVPAPPPPIQENGIHKPVFNNNNNIYKPNGGLANAPVHVLKPSAKTKQKTPQVPRDPNTPKKPTKSKAKKKTPEEAGKEVPVPPPAPPPKPPPKSKSKKKQPPPPPTPEMQNNTITTNSNFVTPPKKKSPKKKKPPATPATSVVIKSESGVPPTVTVPTPSPVVQEQVPPMASPQTSGPTRIVQTIQLTPQNQQLLRNIQAQIQRLLSLAKRNETEQTALQKLIVLQQQVIATGTPVPNPAHLQTLSGTQGAVPLQPGTNVGVTVLKGPIPTSTTLTAAAKASAIQNTTSSIEAQFQAQTIKLNTCVPASLSPTANNISSPSPSQSQPPPLINTVNANATPMPTRVPAPSPVLSVNINTNANSSFCNGASMASPNDGYSQPEAHVKVEPEDESALDKVTSSSVTVTTTTSSMTGYNGNSYYQTPEEHAQALIEQERLEKALMARLQADEEERILWRKDEFESRIASDQRYFLEPDYDTPFISDDDVVQRLMHYHVARDRNEMSFEEFDEDFADTSVHLLDKFGGMVSKYRALLLKESMKEVGSAERVMLERIFVGEEKAKLEHDRQLVAQGEILDLAPPPPSWVPRIRELVDADMKEMERDSIVNQQVQCAIDSIITFGNNDTSNYPADEGEKIEYDAFGVPISNSNYNSSSSADIDEAVRSIMI